MAPFLIARLVTNLRWWLLSIYIWPTRFRQQARIVTIPLFVARQGAILILLQQQRLGQLGAGFTYIKALPTHSPQQLLVDRCSTVPLLVHRRR